MKIAKVTVEDIPRITALQNRLLLPNTDPDNGFLVSGFSGADYLHFIENYDYFLKAESETGELLGCVMAYHSRKIVSEDLNNSLLRHVVIGEFVLIKQVFVTPDSIGKGVARRLYDRLFELAGSALPFVCVIVMEPFNERSCRFHSSWNFIEFLNFTPDKDKDGVVRKRSAWIRLPRPAAHLDEYIRLSNAPLGDDDGDVMSSRAEALISLYEHEDNLNWTKFGKQTTILFALFASFAYFYEKSLMSDAVPVLVILGLWGVIINFLFLLKIRSGLRYMSTYKEKIKEYDRRLAFYFPKVVPVFRSREFIARKSVTSRLLYLISLVGLVSWMAVAALLLLKALGVCAFF